MHRYSKLQFDELIVRLEAEREREWNGLAADVAGRGIYHSGFHITSILDVGFRYIDELVAKAIDFERTALSHEQTEPSSAHFDDLKQELISLVESQLGPVRSKAIEMGGIGASAVQENTLLRIQRQGASMRESISRQVDILQEELRLGIARPVQGTTIHVAGDVGAINTGTIFGSIQGKVEKLREMHQEELANAIGRLAEAIEKSTIGEDVKRDQMEGIEFLATQAELPPERRNRGVIKAVETTLSTATNIVTIWQQIGPIVMKALGM